METIGFQTIRFGKCRCAVVTTHPRAPMGASVQCNAAKVWCMSPAGICYAVGNGYECACVKVRTIAGAPTFVLQVKLDNRLLPVYGVLQNTFTRDRCVWVPICFHPPVHRSRQACSLPICIYCSQHRTHLRLSARLRLCPRRAHDVA